MSEPTASTALEDELVAWGKAISLVTRGRRSGRVREVTVGFVQHERTLLVAAADATHWARNLLADPACRVRAGDLTGHYRAQELEGHERDAAVAALILKYGTPAERLGGGPAFRLEPVRAQHE